MSPSEDITGIDTLHHRFLFLPATINRQELVRVRKATIRVFLKMPFTSLALEMGAST
jgi:hypothetical protein